MQMAQEEGRDVSTALSWACRVVVWLSGAPFCWEEEEQEIASSDDRGARVTTGGSLRRSRARVAQTVVAQARVAQSRSFAPSNQHLAGRDPRASIGRWASCDTAVLSTCLQTLLPAAAVLSAIPLRPPFAGSAAGGPLQPWTRQAVLLPATLPIRPSTGSLPVIWELLIPD